jgi:hypothetical protein
MKIVCTHNENHYTLGLACAATYANIEFIFWNPSVKPTYDMFHEIKPDILLCYKDETIDGLEHYVKENPTTLVHYMDNNYGINLVHLKESERIEMPGYDRVCVLDEDLNTTTLERLKDVCKDNNILVVGDFRADIPEYVGRVSILEKYAAIRKAKMVVDNSLGHYFWESKYLGKHYFNLHFGIDKSDPLSEQTYFHRLSEILLKYNFQEASDQLLKSLGALLDA